MTITQMTLATLYSFRFCPVFAREARLVLGRLMGQGPEHELMLLYIESHCKL